ncbi:MAG: hypothetical protein M3R60_01145 [Pseudomonadota bacterium]|nr:hypothetical protein [Pseudomonadota bacterium]
MNTASTEFPKFRRTVNLLVAGHRSERLGDQAQAALARLEQVLARFAALADDTELADHLFGPALYTRNRCTVQVTTGPADGVDARAIEIAQALRLPVRVLSAGAGGAPGAVSFGCPPEVLRHDDATYALRDELALLHADVLIAVWDGKPAQGHGGGVVRLLQSALQTGTPVLWIDMAGDLREPAQHRLDAAALYHLSQNVFRQNVDGGSMEIFTEPFGDPLTPGVRTWFDPFAGIDGQDDHDPLRALRDYADERAGSPAREKRARLIDNALCGAAGLNRSRLSKLRSDDPTKPYFDIPAAFPVSAALAARFDWSDVRANVAAGRHRSGVWMLYLLSSFAVLAAVAGTLHTGVAHDGWQALFWPTIEGLILLSILVIVRRALDNKWHVRWLGHRFMAEQLRYLVLTQPFLGVTGVLAMPLFKYDHAAGRLALISSELWILRRTMIQDGLPGSEEGYDYCAAPEKPLLAALRTVIEGTALPQPSEKSEQQGQIGYHRGKKTELGHLHANLHGLARGLFGLSLLAVVLHFVLPMAGFHQIEWLLFATAFCPALAASLHGIQTKLEVARVAEFSRETVHELENLLVILQRHEARTDGSMWERKVFLRATALHAAHILSEEANSWRALIGEQATEIPA